MEGGGGGLRSHGGAQGSKLGLNIYSAIIINYGCLLKDIHKDDKEKKETGVRIKFKYQTTSSQSRN